MKRHRFVLMALLPLGGSSLFAASLHDALTATQMLRSIGINSAYVARFQEVEPSGDKSEPIFRAVFDFEGIVWCYASEMGTKILGPTPEPQRDYFQELTSELALIAPPRTSITIQRRAMYIDEVGLSQRSITNACVIGSLVALAQKILDQGLPDEAGLILFGFDSTHAPLANTVHPVDHCVLVYRTNQTWSCIDSLKKDEVLTLEHVTIGKGIDPVLLAVSQNLNRSLQRAFYLPISRKNLREIEWRINLPPPTPSYR